MGQKGLPVFDQNQETAIISRREIWGYRGTLPLSEVEFQKLAAARMILAEGLTLEHNYDLLIANYIELEQEQLMLAVQSAIRQDWNYGKIEQALLQLNQRLFNLLASARFYCDSYESHLQKMKSAGSAHINIESIKSLLAQCYEQNAEYRFMEALRNHSQHHGLPVHLVSYKWRRVEGDEPEIQLEYAVDFISESQTLGTNPKFKKNVLEEINDKVDLKLTSRKYMECIGSIQAKIRSETAAFLADAREYIRQIIELCRKQPDFDLVGLAAYTVFENGTRKREFPVLLEWDDVRIALEKKNGSLKRVASLHITSKSQITNEQKGNSLS